MKGLRKHCYLRTKDFRILSSLLTKESDELSTLSKLCYATYAINFIRQIYAEICSRLGDDVCNI